ncbi:Cation efflux system protein CusB precursor [Providencia rettgeri]|uniref:efflux RND transporter periplasmic adaptor subunit n=1 Tax=Providencia TaxID=586 RepID=UPI000D8AC3EA|nr:MULTISPECIES: efflux RND transporter periplasmic adaptor subunit [Providencia]MBN6364874.1 efflux RND transporter periplasmic adaptor subunit [Providencia rettgeri]MCL0011090.1 efflux RND transporter periplasmic adaptor subunit [Providencia rettgeri]SPZ21801.1 Cation efflux system protein CusB precursor [Providencia rettgeri]
MSLVNLTKLLLVIILSSVISILFYRYFFVIENISQSVEKQERTVLYWYDPMYPNTKFDQPGKSPFMDMDLVPKYADENLASANSKGVTINPTQTQNLGLKTVDVKWGKLNYDLTFPAEIAFNDHQFAIVQARENGFVEKVYPFTVGERIQKGVPIAELTIPAWVEAQSEYLALKQMNASQQDLNSVIERLRLNGMPEGALSQFIKTGKVQTRFTIQAPISGVITALNLRLGMNVSKEVVIAQIQGTDPLWINASVPQSVAELLNQQTQFTVSIPAYPSQLFTVKNWLILPSADQASRTINIRTEIADPNHLLKSGMTAYLNLVAEGNESLLIPSQAIVDSGKEQHVIAVGENGEFIPKRVRVLSESQQMTAISEGLQVGEHIVTQGIFLIDSEANIAGALAKMEALPEVSASSNHSSHKSQE